MKAGSIFRVFSIILSLNYQSLNGQSWIIKTPMPTGRHNAGAVSIGNLIYVLAGGTPSAQSNNNEVYNTTTDSWSTLAPVPTARGECGVAVVNNKIYVIGGYNGSALNIVEEYDPSTNNWTTKAPMPTARSQFSIAVVSNKIYVMGGGPGDPGITAFEVYDPATNTWDTKAPLPLGRHQFNGAAGYTNNKLYFISGRNPWVTTYFYNNSCYDVITNTWTDKSVSPIAFYSGTATIDETNGNIHVIGGTNAPYGSGAATFVDHNVYNISSDQWTSGVSLPAKRAFHVAAIVNNKIYVIGGKDEFGNTVNTVYEISFSALPLKWGNFSGHEYNNTIILNWETLQEENTKEFIIEQSTNGIDWTNIGKVNASYQSTTVKKYSFIHTTPAVGQNLYRIDQRDIDDKKSYSKTITINCKSKNEYLRLYSNPVTNMELCFTLSNSGTVRLYNETGTLIIEKACLTGDNKLAVSNIPKGVYFLKVNNTVQEFIIQ